MPCLPIATGVEFQEGDQRWLVAGVEAVAKDAPPPRAQGKGQALPSDPLTDLDNLARPVIDLLTVGESRQMTAVAEKIRTALLTAGDIYLLSTFRLPPKQGGVLFGLYSRQDNTRWLEASVVGKINKGGHLLS